MVPHFCSSAGPCWVSVGNPIVNDAKYGPNYMNDTHSLSFRLKKHYVQNVWSNLTFLFFNIFSTKLNVRLNEIHFVIKCIKVHSYWAIIRHEICDLLSTWGGRRVQRVDILLCCVTWLLIVLQNRCPPISMAVVIMSSTAHGSRSVDFWTY